MDDHQPVYLITGWCYFVLPQASNSPLTALWSHDNRIWVDIGIFCNIQTLKIKHPVMACLRSFGQSIRQMLYWCSVSAINLQVKLYFYGLILWHESFSRRHADCLINWPANPFDRPCFPRFCAGSWTGITGKSVVTCFMEGNPFDVEDFSTCLSYQSTHKRYSKMARSTWTSTYIRVNNLPSSILWL